MMSRKRSVIFPSLRQPVTIASGGLLAPPGGMRGKRQADPDIHSRQVAQ
jgi:hypothetical protein